MSAQRIGQVAAFAAMGALTTAATIRGRVAHVQREEALHTLGETRARLHYLLAHSGGVITVVDADGRYSYVSPSISTVTGLLPGELLGANAYATVHPDDHATLRRLLQAPAPEPGTSPDAANTSRTALTASSVQVRVRHADGEWHPHEVRACSLVDTPSVRGTVLHHQDVTELHALRTRLAEQATNDELTGLPDEWALMRAATAAVARARRHQRALGVLIVEVKDLEWVGEHLGTGAADQMVQQLAQRLVRTVRAEDTVSRLAPHRFAVLLEELTEVAVAHVAADRILAGINQAMIVDGELLVPHLLIGVAGTPAGELPAEELLAAAAAALGRTAPATVPAAVPSPRAALDAVAGDAHADGPFTRLH